MLSTGKSGRFDTSALSPVFGEFYQTSGFSSPLVQKKRMLKHISEFEEPRTAEFQLEMQAYRDQKKREKEAEVE